MADNKIDFKNMLHLLQSGQWISLSVISANTTKYTGGELITYTRCRIARRREKSVAVVSLDKKKNKRQGFHFTRNIETGSGKIRTIHPLLIESINGRQVI